MKHIFLYRKVFQQGMYGISRLYVYFLDTMRAGLVGSGYETVALLSVLPLDQVEVFLFLDRAYRPRAVKEQELVSQRVMQGVEYLLGQGVDFVIVPPSYESVCRAQWGEKILPLFATYIHDYVCHHSLIGKLGLLANRSDLSHAEQVVKQLVKEIERTERQQKIKLFNASFPLRTKEISHRQFHLPFAGRRDRMIRNLIKTDMRYFKDAAVDTLVPLDRSLLYREKQIKHHLSSKMRFHGRDAVRTILQSYLPEGDQSSSSPIHIHATALPKQLLASKPRKRLLAQGNQREIDIMLID